MNLYERPDVYARRWFLLGILSLSLVLVVMSVSGLNVALPALQRDVGLTGPELQWVLNAYAIAFGGLLLTGGAIGDRYGRKGALLAGLGVFGLGALAGGLATSAAVILAARAVMGLGAAFVMPATLSLIVEIFPPAERPRAIAVWSGFAGGGAALGPLLTGLFVTGWWFVPAWGWEVGGFIYNVPVVALVVAAVSVWLPRSRDPLTPPLDPVGAGLSIVAVTAVVYAIIEGPERGWTSPAIVAGFAVAAVFAAALVAWQRRARHPMLPLELFADRRFSVGSAVIALVFLIMIGFWFLFALYVQFALGYSALLAGLSTMPEASASMLASPFVPAVADRLGSRRTMALGFAILAGTFVFFAFADSATSYWYLLGPLILAGIGLSLAMIPATNDIMAATPFAKAGVGSAVNDTSRELGAALGIATLGALSTSIYRSGVDTGGMPAELAELAGESVGAAIEAAHALTGAGLLAESGARAAVAEAGRAFSAAFAQTMAVSAVLSLVIAAALALAARRRGRLRSAAATGAEAEPETTGP